MTSIPIPTLDPMTCNEAEAIALFGEGSELLKDWREFQAVRAQLDQSLASLYPNETEDEIDAERPRAMMARMIKLAQTYQPTIAMDPGFNHETGICVFGPGTGAQIGALERPKDEDDTLKSWAQENGFTFKEKERDHA